MALFRSGMPHIQLQLAVDTLLVNGAPVVWSSAQASEQWPWPAPLTTEIVVPRDGLYVIGFCYATTVPNVNTLVDARMTLNAVQLGPRERPGTSTNAPRGGGAHALYQLVAGDVWSFNVGFSGGAVFSLQALHTHLFAYRVGPVRYTQ